MNTYDKVHSVYSDIVKDKTSISKEKVESSKFEKLLMFFLDWKVVFGVFGSIIIAIAIIADKSIKYLESLQKYSEYGVKMMSLFVYGLVINLFLTLFTITFYFYKGKIIGSKGQKGGLGEKGLQGKDDLCDICNLKPERIKRSKKLMETTDVEEPAKLEDLNKVKSGWHKEEVNLKIGNTEFCKDCEHKKYVYTPDIKYMTGLVANFNKGNKNIDSFQFIYKDIDNNTKLQGGSTGKWGSKKDNVTELMCPASSAIYKIESMYMDSSPTSNSSLNGIKIFCKDVKTKAIKTVKTNSVGIEVDEGSRVFKHTNLSCKDKSLNGKQISGFLANASGTYDKTQLNQITFSKCNYYY